MRFDAAGLVREFEHPAWLSLFATAVGYGVILGVMTLVLFVLPYLVFVLL